MSELIFEEPTNITNAGPGRPSPIATWVAELRNHPGKWAKYPERVHGAAPTQLKKGRAYGAEPGEFEAAGRNLADRRCDLYARYVGKP